MCLGAIYWARPARVYYAATAEDASQAGFDDSFIYRQIALAHGERAIPMIALATPEDLRPFAAWRAKAGRKAY
jgi:tRNA(Arg) A34 adenosine deaminase TadA